jgi:hypothetical protein
MGGEAERYPDLAPDTRQGWVENWLRLAAEEAEGQGSGDRGQGSGDSRTGMTPDPCLLTPDWIARRLGAVERRGHS